jgi:hypothetical protein
MMSVSGDGSAKKWDKGITPALNNPSGFLTVTPTFEMTHWGGKI